VCVVCGVCVCVVCGVCVWGVCVCVCVVLSCLISKSLTAYDNITV